MKTNDKRKILISTTIKFDAGPAAYTFILIFLSAFFSSSSFGSQNAPSGNIKYITPRDFTFNLFTIT